MSTRTFRTLLQVLNSDADHQMDHWDVSTAIHSCATKRVYMKQATGHEVPGKESWVCLLLKALYGTKTSRTCMATTSQGSSCTCGFQPLVVDPATYVWHKGADFRAYWCTC